MNGTGWSHIGGVAAMLGGALSVLYSFVGETHWSHVPLDAARHIFLAAGVTGLYFYLRCSDRFGWLGTVGFCLCLAAFVLVAALDFGILMNEGVERLYISLGPVRALLLIAGSLLFGMAALRSAALPRGGAMLLVVAALSSPVAILVVAVSGGRFTAWIFTVPTILFGLAWLALGYALWTRRDAAAGQPARAR
jgi:hypothetical protein